MPRRRTPRFRRVRRVGMRLRRGGRRVRKGIGGRFGSWQEIGKGGVSILLVKKIKDYMGFHLGGPAVDQDIDMILAGFVPKLGNQHLVPAGASALVAHLADGFIFGGGQMGGSNLAGGVGKGGNFAGD